MSTLKCVGAHCHESRVKQLSVKCEYLHSPGRREFTSCIEYLLYVTLLTDTPSVCIWSSDISVVVRAVVLEDRTVIWHRV